MGIHRTAIVHKKAKISKEVSIGPYTIVGENVEIGYGCQIGPHVFLDGWTKIGKNCKILAQSAIGTPPQYLEYKGEKTRVVIGENNIIREFVTINRGTKEGGGETKIGNNNFLMAYVHIAHDCRIGDGVTLANVATLAGHVTVEDYAVVGGIVAVHQYVRIGAYAMIGGFSPVRKDIIPYIIGAGDPLRVSGINTIGLKRHGFSRKEISILKEAFRLIFRSKLNLSRATEKIEQELEKTDSIKHLLEFLRTSKRGICK